MENPCYVASHYNIQKEQALPFCSPGFVGFVNGKRPGKAETKQHHNFKNAHNYSLMLDATFYFPKTDHNIKKIWQPIFLDSQV
jgi:hypothetical protein